MKVKSMISLLKIRREVLMLNWCKEAGWELWLSGLETRVPVSKNKINVSEPFFLFFEERKESKSSLFS